MFRFSNKRDPLEWYHYDVELQRLEVYEADLLQQLEILQGPALTRVQALLNQIAYSKAKINQMEKDYESD